MTTRESQPRPESKRGGARRAGISRRRIVFGVLAIIIITASWAAVGLKKPAPAPPAPAGAAPLTAHGAVAPAARATVATMSGGVVRALAVRVGQSVNQGERIAEVSTATETEILVAPWSGTVMGLSARLGDTLMPGAVVAAVGDLSRYQVETTDVDEYLIGQIQPEQPVSMTVDALDGRKLDGTVDTVALVQQTSSSGVTNYPIVIQFAGHDADLRPGMTVRIVFAPSAAPASGP